GRTASAWRALGARRSGAQLALPLTGLGDSITAKMTSQLAGLRGYAACTGAELHPASRGPGAGRSAARPRGIAVIAGIERMAAGAALYGVRVVNIEAATHEGVDIVDLRTA